MDLSEAEHPLEAYGSVNHLFTRRLAPGLRTWSREPAVVGSPVDGIVGQAGPVVEGRLLQAKGRWYSAAALAGGEGEAGPYLGGFFLTLYLSPRHYHRIHSPASGQITLARHIPGGLLPVNVPAVQHVPDLFVRNERVVLQMEGTGGGLALVAVGATNVGGISTAFDPGWGGGGAGPEGLGAGSLPAPITNRSTAPEPLRRYRPPLPVRAGDEVMAFHLGSTVVLLLSPGTELVEGIIPGREIRLGTPVARFPG